jgi:hypothetical protein
MWEQGPCLEALELILKVFSLLHQDLLLQLLLDVEDCMQMVLEEDKRMYTVEEEEPGIIQEEVEDDLQLYRLEQNLLQWVQEVVVLIGPRMRWVVQEIPLQVREIMEVYSAIMEV